MTCRLGGEDLHTTPMSMLLQGHQYTISAGEAPPMDLLTSSSARHRKKRCERIRGAAFGHHPAMDRTQCHLWSGRVAEAVSMRLLRLPRQHGETVPVYLLRQQLSWVHRHGGQLLLTKSTGLVCALRLRMARRHQITALNLALGRSGRFPHLVR